MKTIYALLLSAVFITQSAAQQKELWKVTVPENINWQKLTPLGLIIVATSKGLYGIDPVKGAISWKQNHAAVAGIAEDNYEVIDNTPYVAIVSKGQFPQHVVINSSDGKILCNSNDAQIKGVTNRYILYETGNILIYGITGSLTAKVALFDISTGQMKWAKENLFGKGLFAEKLQGKPLEAGPDALIASTTGGVYKINTQTGEQIWKTPLPKMSVQSASETEVKLIRSVREGEFYFLFNMYAQAYKFSDGSQLWKKPAKQSGLTDRVIFDPEGLMIASAVDPKNNIVKPKLSLFNYETGEEKWKEGAKLNGTITHYNYSDKGLIIAMQSEKGNYSINIVNLDNGEYILKKALKVKGTLDEIRLTPKGLLYVTDNEINILDLETGKEIFAPSIKCGAEEKLIYTEKEKLMYVYSPADKDLYKIDLNAGTNSVLFADVKFDDNEKPTVIEMRNQNILLTSAQNMTLFSPEGKQIYHTYYPAPQLSGFAKTLYGISAVLHGFDAMRYGAASASFSAASTQTTDPAGRAMYAAFGDLTNQVSNANMSAAKAEMDMIRKRYNATAAAQNFLFMNTKLDKGIYGLVKLNKENGKKEGEISFGSDKQPVYEIDDIVSQLYYRSTPTQIACYKF